MTMQNGWSMRRSDNAYPQSVEIIDVWSAKNPDAVGANSANVVFHHVEVPPGALLTSAECEFRVNVVNSDSQGMLDREHGQILVTGWILPLDRDERKTYKTRSEVQAIFNRNVIGITPGDIAKPSGPVADARTALGLENDAPVQFDTTNSEVGVGDNTDAAVTETDMADTTALQARGRLHPSLYYPIGVDAMKISEATYLFGMHEGTQYRHGDRGRSLPLFRITCGLEGEIASPLNRSRVVCWVYTYTTDGAAYQSDSDYFLPADESFEKHGWLTRRQRFGTDDFVVGDFDENDHALWKQQHIRRGINDALYVSPNLLVRGTFVHGWVGTEWYRSVT